MSQILAEESDNNLINSYKAGNSEAFRVLIDRHVSSLYNFVARITNANDAPDIVQEIFIKIWKNLDRFDGTKASFKTWIFTIARNTTTDFLRKKKSILFSDIENINEEENFADKIEDENILPLETLEKLEDQELLNNTLKNLSADENEILILHYQEDMTFDEIGKILDKSLNTVKSTHRRALIKLRKMIS